MKVTKVIRVLRPHLTYANVTTTLLLFLVLGGGGAYALSGHNSVRSDDIAPGQVKTDDLAGSAVTGDKVKSNSIEPGDINGLVAGPHGSASVDTGDPAVGIDFPLADATWTQPAGEVQMITGTVTYRTPSGTCLLFGEPTSFGYGELNLARADGRNVGGAYLVAFPQDTVKTVPISAAPKVMGGGGPIFLYGPSAKTTQTVSAQVSDLCDDDNFTVQSVDISVTGIG